MASISAAELRRKKTIILCMGVALSFFTSMSKVLLPGPIYNILLGELRFSAAQIGMLGAGYMYAYASSQLLMGIFSARYDGVRILLIGGGLFAAGSVGFPLCSSFWGIALFRMLCGFGAGTTFLGIAKLLNDLFPARFAFALGIVLFISYFGPVTGLSPMVSLIGVIGWRKAMFIPGICCAVLMTIIVLKMKGTLQPPVKGQTFSPLIHVLKNPPMLLLSLSSSLIFGIYYALLTQMGQKCLQDFYGFTPFAASGCIMALAILVASNNITCSLFVKLLKGRKLLLVTLGYVMALAGSICGCITFAVHGPAFWLVLAFVLIAFPAGFFSLYSDAAKDICPPEETGFAVAFVNFAAFVMIAVFGNISGNVLNHWQDKAVNGIFPGEAYISLFAIFSAAAAAALVLGLLTRPGKRA